MNLLPAGLSPLHLRALDHRFGGRLVAALRRVLEGGHRPTLNVSWLGEHRRWRLVVRGLDDEDQVRAEIVLEVVARRDAGPDVATVTLLHLATSSFREELVADVLGAKPEPAGRRCPPS